VVLANNFDKVGRINMYIDEKIHDETLWKRSEVMRNFVDILSLASDEEYEEYEKDEDVKRSDERKALKGRSVQEITGTDEEITIYRACSAKNYFIHPMDYVTRSKKWATEHAEHNVVVKEEDQHVIYALVHPKDVYEAPNAGEFLYDGPKINARRLKLVVSLDKAHEEEELLAEKMANANKAKVLDKLRKIALDCNNATASYLIERAVLDIESL
jgi:hypothetical protein